MKFVIGLTGNIASGKSTVSSILRQQGAQIVDADKIARQVVRIGSPALEEIVRVFGNEMIQPDGSLNRKALGKHVFSDPEELKKLNALVHPRIRKVIVDKIDAFHKNSDHTFLVVDSALLFETGLDQYMDRIWFVDADESVRLARLVKRDDMSSGDARERIQSQQPAEVKKSRSDWVIHNEGTIEELHTLVCQKLRDMQTE